jgi:ribosomal protein S18 acetylase RimI-like enzyme
MHVERNPKQTATAIQDVAVRPAKLEDIDFSWGLYAEAVKPFIAPYISTHQKREWIDEHEKASFAKWWTPENTSIIMLGKSPVGWLHFEETDAEITLVNFCVSGEFRRRGIASRVLGMLLEGWKGKRKPILHSVLKQSPCKEFFESRGFKVIGEDEITFSMKCSTLL